MLLMYLINMHIIIKLLGLKVIIKVQLLEGKIKGDKMRVFVLAFYKNIYEETN